jgi:hypothetical protein
MSVLSLRLLVTKLFDMQLIAVSVSIFTTYSLQRTLHVALREFACISYDMGYSTFEDRYLHDRLRWIVKPAAIAWLSI